MMDDQTQGWSTEQTPGESAKPDEGWSTEQTPAAAPAPPSTGGANWGSRMLAAGVGTPLLGILNAFGQQDYGWDAAKADFAEADAAIDKAYAGRDTRFDIGKAAYKEIMVPAAAVIDLAVRAGSGVFRGAQDALATMLPRDVAVMLTGEQSMGSPHFPVDAATRFEGVPVKEKMAEPLASVVPSPIGTVEGATPGIPRSKMAMTGDPMVDAFLHSPVTQGAIDSPVVDRSHTVPYTAGGSVPLADPTIYIDHRFPKEIEAPRLDGQGTVKFDPAEPFAIHENVEQRVMESLIGGGMDEKTAYRVAHYEFAEKAEGAWYRNNGIDQEAAEKIYEPIMDRIQKGADDNPPENLYEKPYPHDNEHLAKGPDAIDHRPSAEEIAAARKILGGTDDVHIAGGTSDNVSLPHYRDSRLIGEDAVARALDPGTPAPEAAKILVPPMQASHGSPFFRDVLTDSEGNILPEAPSGVTVTYAGKQYTGAKLIDAVTAAKRDHPNISIDRIFDEVKPQTLAPPAIHTVRIHGRLEETPANDEMSGKERLQAELKVQNDILNWYYQLKRGHFKPSDYKSDAARYQAAISIQNSDELIKKTEAKVFDLEDRISNWKGNINQLDPNDIDLTHTNGVPVGNDNLSARARLNELPPEPPRGPPGGRPPGGGEPPEEPPGPPRQVTDKAGNIRLDLLRDSATPDALGFIAKVAEENGGDQAFMPARRGQITLGQAEAISQATGIAVKDLDLLGIGRKLRNDDMVRAAVQTMIQSAEDASAAMKKAALSGSVEDLIAAQERMMWHSVIQEQVAGLTAEWGRTGNVFQEFSERVKDARSLGDFLRDKKGDKAPSLDDLRQTVRDFSNLDPRTALPRALQTLRKATFADKVFYSWVHGLISGLVSHTRYFAANTGWLGFDSLAVKPVAAAIGAVRALVSKDVERVYFGEGAVQTFAMIRALPDAIAAAMEAVADDVTPPLGREVTKGINPWTGTGNPFESKIGKAYGEIVGVPGRMFKGLHTFQRVLAYQGHIEAEGYRAAVKDGAKPWTADFWHRQADHAAFPEEDVLDKGVDYANTMAFTAPLGEKAAGLSRAIGRTPLRWIFPFRNIPGNIFHADLQGIPVLNLANKSIRDEVFGRNGQIPRDMAFARMTLASSIAGWVAYKVLSDQATGGGPPEQKQREEWLLTHQPYSIRVGDQWISYNKLGPIGAWMGLGADLTEVAPHIKDGDWEKAAAHIVVAGGRWVMDETGMAGLANLFDLVREPERKSYIASNFASSFIPFSTLANQSAAMLDPYMRDARSFLDSAKLHVPGEAWGFGRQSIPVKRDWLGNPVQNPAEWAIMRHSPTSNDPVSLEMQRLDLTPAPPSRTIGGEKLSPEAYDRFQVLAGAPLSMKLHQMVTQPGWQSLEPGERAAAITATIRSYRRQAEGAMKMENHRALLQQIQEDKVRRWLGMKPTQ